jgi:hypothetical protein
MQRPTARTDALGPLPVPATTIAAPTAGLNRNQNGLLAFSQFAEAHLALPPPKTLASRVQRSFLGSAMLAQVIGERADDLISKT